MITFIVLLISHTAFFVFGYLVCRKNPPQKLADVMQKSAEDLANRVRK